jgi:hypothetical protein
MSRDAVRLVRFQSQPIHKQETFQHAAIYSSSRHPRLSLANERSEASNVQKQREIGLLHDFSHVPTLSSIQPTGVTGTKTDCSMQNQIAETLPHLPVIQRKKGSKKAKQSASSTTTVTEEVIASYTGKTLQQLPIKSEEKVAQCTGFMSSYPSVGGSVTFNGKSRGVYNIGGGRWGYVDTSHGEIEAFPANQMSGTTTHIVPIRFDYDEVKKTIKGVETTLYRITNISTLAAVAVTGAKAHHYTIN